jgi:hypothetical protein
MSEVSQQAKQSSHDERHDPSYSVNIEGVECSWSAPTITTEDIANLGGWDSAQGVIEVDPDNNERTLAPGELVHIKPGHGFAKRVRWKRGDSLFVERLELELALLKGRFPVASREREWFLIPDYRVGVEGWNREATAVAFRAQAGYPAAQPYGLFVPSGIRFRDVLPQNYQEPAGDKPPFPPTVWGLFSWGPDDGEWRPATTPGAGSNLLNFAVGFSARFHQGA